MKILVGVDEVGRGPVAGPVAVCAFTCPADFFDSVTIDVPLRDSKKLTEKQRNAWYLYLKEAKKSGLCDYAVSYVGADMIDVHGINPAIKKALETSLSKLSLTPSEVSIYLDGGLHAPVVYIHQETIIRGDQLHPVISCASIIAKVSRDSVMRRHALEYPGYGFDAHVGYGTKAHYEAIDKEGMCPLHRRSFLKRYKVTAR